MFKKRAFCKENIESNQSIHICPRLKRDTQSNRLLLSEIATKLMYKFNMRTNILSTPISRKKKMKDFSQYFYGLNISFREESIETLGKKTNKQRKK